MTDTRDTDAHDHLAERCDYGPMPGRPDVRCDCGLTRSDMHHHGEGMVAQSTIDRIGPKVRA